MKLLFLLLVGCVQPYRVMREAMPSPFGPPCLLELAAVRFDGAQVGNTNVEEWQARKGADGQTSWAEDKFAFARNFNDALLQGAGPFIVTGAEPTRYVMQPRVVFYEPGFYAYVASRNTEVVMQVAVIDAKTNDEVDLVESHAFIAAELTNPSSGGRFQRAGRVLGERVARYVTDRLATCKR